jgi:hypothetical protein
LTGSRGSGESMRPGYGLPPWIGAEHRLGVDEARHRDLSFGWNNPAGTSLRLRHVCGLECLRRTTPRQMLYGSQTTLRSAGPRHPLVGLLAQQHRLLALIDHQGTRLVRRRNTG